MKHILCAMALAISLFFIANNAKAQGMAVNTTGSAADASAILDASSTTKGMLVPRMTTAQRSAIASPATGLLIYQTDGTPGFYYYTGSAWSALGGSSLPSGTNGQVLTMVGGVPTWVSPLFYSIMAITGVNGTVSPLGISGVIPAASQVYSITPNVGSSVNNVTVDGISVGAVSTYTFTSVAANHTINATFINTYSITATSGANGTVTPSGIATVTYGDSQAYTITPGTGYHTYYVSVDAVSAGTPATYTFYSVSSSHTISAGFTTIPPIGSAYGGGKVAYFLQPGDPGFSSTVAHGLIAATSDQSTGIQWWNGIPTTTYARGQVIGTGSANTAAIITSQGAGSYAASICNSYTGGSYTDWYLPSRNELNELYINEVAIGGFAGAYYWSSSEATSGVAFFQDFYTGPQGGAGKDATYYVRAVRAF